MVNCKMLKVSGLEVYVDYAIIFRKQLLSVSFFHSAVNMARGVGANLMLACGCDIDDCYYNLRTYEEKERMWKVSYLPIYTGRNRFISAVATNKDIGIKYMITDNKHLYRNLYQILMKNFCFPLMEDWMPYLEKELRANGYLQIYDHGVIGITDYSRKIKLNGELVSLCDIFTAQLIISQEQLEEIISNGLRKKEIWITPSEVEPLDFIDFNDYISRYGKTLVSNLEKKVKPLSPLKGSVETIALKKKGLFPQQAACVNGINALKQAGIKYGIMAEGMGVGKTLQASSTVEAYFNQKWLKKNPKKTLRDCYSSNEVCYRNIVMAPGHLLKKWKEEIESEIPLAKGIIIEDYSQLIQLRKVGKKRTAKEFYIISKDFAKLGSSNSPIPSIVASKMAKLKVCANCNSNGDRDSKCSKCGSKKWNKTNLYYGRGLLCPFCGELLLRYSPKLGKEDQDDTSERILRPQDFSFQTASNSICYHCGRELWGVNAANINCKGNDMYLNKLAERKPKWYKIGHFTSFTKKTRTSAFVLRGHESDYLLSNNISFDSEGVTVLPREKGVRKSAPSLYIKKYLKGYFDFLILDEVHKFEGQGTAQSVAAQALMKASSFTLGLTGTISNGTAASLFSLLFMLEPKRLLSKGYQWKDALAFSKKYGTVETVYKRSTEDTYNSSSRGKMIGQPTVKPGISPLLFIDFLMDRAVFLDISDLSKYLPPLKEKVLLVEPEDDMLAAYKDVLQSLKSQLRTKEGAKSMGAMLQFALSYPDKPYKRSKIMSANTKDFVLASPLSLDYMIDNRLMNKEQELVDIVNKELMEDRNVFVYATYTGDGETNISDRLQAIIEEHCNLKGRVQILRSETPTPAKREKWIQKRASEGIKVFITNPKCVETGLDFCFNYEGKEYNFPTLIFYQMNYELATIWQASRRAYRLSQTKECRTYYMGYANTLQQTAIEIMAQKQVAASAIQGKFSTEGLSAMASGVDARVKMAEALSKEDNYADRQSIENMFDVLNKDNDVIDNSEPYVKPLTYYELVGEKEENGIDFFMNAMSQYSYTMPEQSSESSSTSSTSEELEELSFEFTTVSYDSASKKTKRKEMEGQFTFFDLF